jgi:tetratricopeptide (TPR) repeat protein
MIAHLEGDLDVALNYHRRSREIFERIGETGGLTGSQYGLALVHASRGAHREALTLLDEALALRRRLYRPADIAATLTAKGVSHVALGEHAAAERCYDESLRLCRATGNTRWTAANLCELAQLRIAQGRPTEARPLLEEAIPLYERTGQRNRITACRALLATLPPA